MSAIYEIEQRIAAGDQFGGGVPSLTGDVLTPLDAQGKRVFVDGAGVQVEGDDGGEFDFPFAASSLLWKIDRVFLAIGSGASYVLKVVSGSDEVEVSTGTGDDAYILNDVATLGRGDKLVLSTTGATVAMKARVIARPIIPLPA